MVCKGCQNEISDNNLPCPYCGYDSQNKNRDKHKFSFGKVLLIAVCIIVLVASIFFANQIIECNSVFSSESSTLSVTKVTTSETSQIQTSSPEESSETQTENPLLNAEIQTYSASSEKGIRAEIIIEKSVLQSLSQEQFKNFCQTTVQNSNYSWLTVKCSDSIGMVFLENNISVILFGVLDKNGLISNATGYIIKQPNGDYSYLTVSDFQEETTENIDEPETEATTQSASTSQSASVSEESSQTVYVTSTGTKFHKSSCSYLGNSIIAIEKDEALKKGYTACSRCNP